MDMFLAELECVMNNEGKNNYLDVKRLQNHRIRKYDELAQKFTSFDILKYDKNKWHKEAIELSGKKKLCWKNCREYHFSKWHQFQEAIKMHHRYISKEMYKDSGDPCISQN